MDASADPFVGRILNDRYRIQGVLGMGGFSVVYRAEHLTLGRPFAIKVLPDAHEHAGWMRPRFEREAQLLARLFHPNIVTVVDYGIAEGIAYMAMELVEGESLRDVIDRAPMPFDLSMHITRQILRGLGHAHGLGVIHRDLKPTNVVLARLPDSPDHVKILDFGFGKWFGTERNEDLTPMTEMGKAFGTPGYIAPERLSEKPADGRADIYAVGAILFEMLTGRRPFEGTALEVMHAHMLAPLPGLSEVRPDLTFAPEVEDVVRRAMAKDPEARYANAAEMLEALDHACKGPRSVPPPPPSEPQPSALGKAVPASQPPAPRVDPRVRLAILTVAALTVAALGTGIYTFFSGRARRQEEAQRQARQIVGPAAAETERVALPTLPVDDPWAEPIPARLQPIRERLQRNERVDPDDFGPLFQYVRDHPGDPRPHLLFARAYMLLGYYDVAIKRYIRAYSEDDAARGDPRMLRDLLVVAAGRNGDAAGRAIRTIYGVEALPALGRAIAAVEGHETAAARLMRLRDEIEARRAGAGPQ